MYLNPAIITSTVKFINEIILIYFSARLSSTESRSMLPNLSLVMEFLWNVFTNFIFENLLSHEALVTGKLTATSNNQMQLYK